MTNLTAASPRHRIALLAASGLLLMAVLAPLANFGVLQTLIVPGDDGATVAGIAASVGLFRTAVAALLIVAMLDVAVAWAFYRILRPAHPSMALVVAWFRVVYAAVFALALTNLLGVAQLVAAADDAALRSASLHAQVAASLASFAHGWDVGLAIFGLHLVGVGALVFTSPAFPRVLGVLVAVAGIGYLTDAFGKILLPGYSLTVSSFTFIGEALLMVWLFWSAARGTRDARRRLAGVPAPASSSEAVAL